MLPCQPKINLHGAENTPMPSLPFIDTVITPPPRGERISRDRLVSLRRSRAWSQPKLAKQAGVALGTVKRWESRGEVFPILDFDSIESLAKAFGMEPSVFLQQVAQDSGQINLPAELVNETRTWTNAKLEAEEKAAAARRDYIRANLLKDVLEQRRAAAPHSDAMKIPADSSRRSAAYPTKAIGRIPRPPAPNPDEPPGKRN